MLYRSKSQLFDLKDLSVGEIKLTWVLTFSLWAHFGCRWAPVTFWLSLKSEFIEVSSEFNLFLVGRNYPKTQTLWRICQDWHCVCREPVRKCYLQQETSISQCFNSWSCPQEIQPLWRTKLLVTISPVLTEKYMPGLIIQFPLWALFL